MKRALLIAYEGRIKDGDVIDVVKEDSPLLVILGVGDLIKGLEEALEGMKEGEEKEIEVPPEKGYGERSKDLVVLIPEKEFRQRGIKPYPGLPIEADGRTGRVISVSSGRVQVDFNHPLAGKTLQYKVKVLKEVKDEREIVSYLFKRFFGFEPENVEVSDGTAKISYIYTRNAEEFEVRLVAYLMEHLGFREVRMEKIYRRKEEGQGES